MLPSFPSSKFFNDWLKSVISVIGLFSIVSMANAFRLSWVMVFLRKVLKLFSSSHSHHVHTKPTQRLYNISHSIILDKDVWTFSHLFVMQSSANPVALTYSSCLAMRNVPKTNSFIVLSRWLQLLSCCLHFSGQF